MPMPNPMFHSRRDHSGELVRFRLLASAVAGQPVEVAAVAEGELSYTDGATIFIAIDESPQRQMEILSAQASLIGAGSLVPEVVGQLLRRPALVARYLAVEGHRALRVHEHFLPSRVRWLIDPDIAGLADSPATSMAIAAGRAVMGEPLRQFGTIRPRALAAHVRRAGPNDDTRPHVPSRVESTALRELDESEATEGTATNSFSSPVGGAGAIGRLFKKLFADSRGGGEGSPGVDAPTHWVRRPGKPTRRPVLSRASAPVGGGVLARADGRRYPEWDADRNRYRPGWCTVVETEPVLQESAPMTAPDPASLRRALSRLGVELERQHRQPQGYDVDVDAAVDMYVQLTAGSRPGDAVYIDTVRRRRDLSVLILLDVSGSAAEISWSGEPVHAHQQAATAALALALHQLGDRVAAYAFRSQGRSAVHALPVKRFDEALGWLALRRLQGLSPGAYTRLGAAIRHGSALLERGGGTSRKLLVVISDGFAYDHGYEPAYGEADARKALGEARRRGIGCACLSMGTVGDPDALRRVFGTTAHAAVPRVEQLPAVVAPLFRSALRSAGGQRRAFLTERAEGVARRPA